MANVTFFSPDGGTTRYPIEDTEARSRIDNLVTGVSSFNGRSGSILPMAGDYDATQVNYSEQQTVKQKIDALVTDEQAIQNQLNAQGVLGAKNLLPNNVTSQTINGVTFTVNADGSVTVNGTATANTNFRLVPYADIVDTYLSLWTGKPLRLSGCPSGGSGNTYALEMFYNDGQGHWLRDFGDGVEVSIPTSGLTDVNPNIMVKNGVTVNNLVFKPMLRLASDPDDTYQPHAMTNRELTEAAGVWTNAVSCLTGDTSVTITNSAIHTTSMIDIYYETASGNPITYTSAVVTEGQIVITFASALEEAASIKLRITN